MVKLLLCVAVLTIANLFLFVGASVAQEQRRSNVGTLTCRVGPGVGALIASRRRLACRFNARDGHSEQYAGSVTRFGLDVGFTAGGVMSWVVLARTRGVRRGALAGHYVGASGDVSLGVGGGAKVLVGGSRRAMILQPISVVAQVGVNLALGVAGLELRFLSSPPKESLIRIAPARLAAGLPDFPGRRSKVDRFQRVYAASASYPGYLLHKRLEGCCSQNVTMAMNAPNSPHRKVQKKTANKTRTGDIESMLPETASAGIRA